MGIVLTAIRLLRTDILILWMQGSPIGGEVNLELGWGRKAPGDPIRWTIHWLVYIGHAQLLLPLEASQLKNFGRHR